MAGLQVIDKALFWLRAALAPQPIEGQAELLRLMVKAGRRCAHDLAHAADDVSDRESAAMWRERARMWIGLFYPDGGPKDYRDELHRDIARARAEAQRLRALCIEHGIDPTDPGGTPF